MGLGLLCHISKNQRCRKQVLTWFSPRDRSRLVVVDCGCRVQFSNFNSASESVVAKIGKGNRTATLRVSDAQLCQKIVSENGRWGSPARLSRTTSLLSCLWHMSKHMSMHACLYTCLYTCLYIWLCTCLHICPNMQRYCCISGYPFWIDG